MAYERSLDLPVIGESEIDETHQLQVQLLEEIEASLMETDRESALELLEKLEAYSGAHFDAEQALMRRHSYPAYESHVAEHGKLMDELLILRGRVASAALRELPAETETVRHWLLNHIRSADRSFAAWVEQSEDSFA